MKITEEMLDDWSDEIGGFKELAFLKIKVGRLYWLNYHRTSSPIMVVSTKQMTYADHLRRSLGRHSTSFDDPTVGHEWVLSVSILNGKKILHWPITDLSLVNELFKECVLTEDDK